jgi:ATP-dependent DNA helicase RecG
LIPETENSIENERLAAMEETSDGFVLAERDLEQRGPGDFLGTRQSGFAELRMANLTDIRLIEKARQQASAFFETDPDLSGPDYAALYARFLSFWGVGRGDVS